MKVNVNCRMFIVSAPVRWSMNLLCELKNHSVDLYQIIQEEKFGYNFELFKIWDLLQPN